MEYVCEVGPDTWFRLTTKDEAAAEALLMKHAVDRYFNNAYDAALAAYVPPTGAPKFEQSIGRKGYVERTMPRFLTLRDPSGTPLVTAMLPPLGVGIDTFRPIIVGPGNRDPYPHHNVAIAVLGQHLGYDLDPDRCYPYRRG